LAQASVHTLVVSLLSKLPAAMGNLCTSEDKNKTCIEKVSRQGCGDGPEPQLSVTVVGARGLRGSDWLPGTGKPDCYCEVRRGGATLHTTGTISNTCQPVWFESCEVAELGAPLEFWIYDKDLVGSDFLGKAVLESEDYAEGFNGELKLADARVDEACLKVKVKVVGKDLPPGPPSQYALTVERPSKDVSFGLDLDMQSEGALYVLSVKAGPFADYNSTTTPEFQVKVSDVIVSVNGKTCSNALMLDQFKTETKVECTVRRTVMTAVIFDRGEASEPLGLEIPEKPQGEFMVIKGIIGGAAEKHNSAAEEQERLYPDDRIVSVGTFQGPALRLLEHLEKGSGPVMLSVLRVAAPADQGGLGRVLHWLFG